MIDPRDIARDIIASFPAFADQPRFRVSDKRAPEGLIIVRHDRAEVFETLERHFRDERDVHVMWDRRVAERRTARVDVTRDRRRRDRREVPPATWATLGVVVTNQRQEASSADAAAPPWERP